MLWKHNYCQAIEPKKFWYLDNYIALRAIIEDKGIALDLPFSLTEEAVKNVVPVLKLNGWHHQCWHYSLVCKYTNIQIRELLEWFALRLQNFENLQWRNGYKLCREDFPFYTPDGIFKKLFNLVRNGLRAFIKKIPQLNSLSTKSEAAMKKTERDKLIDELTLALLYLTSFTEEENPNVRMSWKSHDWSAMDRLVADGFIAKPKCFRTHSRTLTNEGIEKAKDLLDRVGPALGFIKKDWES